MPERHRTLARSGLARSLGLVALCVSIACVPKVKGLQMREADLSLPETFGALADPGDPEAMRQAELFDDAELVALIGEALQNNQELEILSQEIYIANAEIIARRGAALPTVDLDVGAGIEKVGRYTARGAADASSEMEPGREVPEHLTDFRLGFSASWEIDIWKKLRHATKAAQTRYLSSIEGRNFVVTGIVAEVADTYYELMALDNELMVLDENLGLLRDALEVVRLQQAAAMVTTLAVQRFEAELLRYESHRYDILQDIVEAENRVNVLCGRYPQSVPRRSDEFRDTSPGSVSSGLPSEMLVRRPDIRAAELDLQAARLDVKVARARFFPSLVIDAELGAEAFSLLKFGVMPASLLYDVAARLMAPLFNRAEIKADYFAANGRQMQAVYGYEQTVLRAFTEVANQLAQIENVDQSYALKERQVSVLHDATATANLLFSSARADYLEVLTTRREALEAEFELIETKRRQMGARIDLYRSLGGGWPQQDPTTDDDATRQVAPGGE